MTFQEYIASQRQSIKDHLTTFMEEKQREDLPSIFKEQQLISRLSDFVLRGKLIRGTLFLLIIEGMGVAVEKKHYDIACAIELMHSSLLIQDDVIDNDRVRRGASTIFAHYEKEGKDLDAYDPYHYGVSTAIVAADVAFFFAIELLSEYSAPHMNLLLKKYAHEVYLVAVAESVDSIFGQTKREPTEEEIYAVYTYKTARYTFSLPFEMAGMVASSSEENLKLLRRLGENAGIIFQLKDDEIGLFGSEEVVGKPIGSDIRENKKTLIRHLLYKYANDEDRKILDECFGNKMAEEREIEKIKSLFDTYGIKKIIDSKIEDLMQQVWKDYQNLDLNVESKDILKGLLEYNLTRSY